MSKNRSMKIALASALAASAIVPAVAVQANEAQPSSATNGYPDGTYTVDFTASNDLVSRFISSPATIQVKDGKFIAEFYVGEAVRYINSATVDGVNALQGQYIRFEFNELKTFNVAANITMPYGEQAGQKVDQKFTITLDPKSMKSVAAGGAPTTGTPTTGAPTTEAPAAEKVFKPGKAFTNIVNGTYDAKFDAYKVTDGKAVGNYKAILSHFEAGTKLIVKDGKYYAQLKVAEKSNGWVDGLYIVKADGTQEKASLVAGSKTGEQQVYEFPITAINDLTNLIVHVIVPEHNMDVKYPFGFAIETKELVATQKTDVFVYKNETNELSIMQGKYLTSDITYTEANGKYAVDLTFPEGQYLNDFVFEGKSIAMKSSEANGNNTVKVYTVNVESLSDIYDATIDLTVAAGPVNYQAKHTVQIQFGGKKNPFTDISKLSNYGKIVSLYSEGIYKENVKFNPYGKVNRSQFALMLQRALAFQVPAAASKFADVTSIKDTETVNAIKALSEKGVINGLPNGTFNPYGEIRRDQAAQMIYRVLTTHGYTGKGLASPFADTVALSTEAKTAIAELNALGIMTGSQGNFNPKNTLTRDQMSKVLANTLQVIDTLK